MSVIMPVVGTSFCLRYAWASVAACPSVSAAGPGSGASGCDVHETPANGINNASAVVNLDTVRMVLLLSKCVRPLSLANKGFS